MKGGKKYFDQGFFHPEQQWEYGDVSQCGQANEHPRLLALGLCNHQQCPRDSDKQDSLLMDMPREHVEGERAENRIIHCKKKLWFRQKKLAQIQAEHLCISSLPY